MYKDNTQYFGEDVRATNHKPTKGKAMIIKDEINNICTIAIMLFSFPFIAGIVQWNESVINFFGIGMGMALLVKGVCYGMPMLYWVCNKPCVRKHK